MIKTLRLKVKKESYSWLQKAANEVNSVFNYCNETAYEAYRRTDKNKKWLSGFDLCYLTAESTNYFDNIGSDVIQCVCVHYAQKRKTAKKIKLKWRKSTGSRKSLGWIPFKPLKIRRKGKYIKFYGKTIRLFQPEKLEGLKWKSGCFAEDAVGDWWLCLPYEVEITNNPALLAEVGIDLGLKTIATTSDGEKLEAGKWTEINAKKLAQAQRRGHKKQAKKIHRYIARCRKDALHKFSRKIVNQYQNIIIGNVSSTKLAKTRMAKSVLDSSWGMLKNFLDYKSQQAARSFQIVNESNTTRVCSNCGQKTGPSGLRQLVVREWTCSECGVFHDRDINAAKNILQLRYKLPCAGTN